MDPEQMDNGNIPTNPETEIPSTLSQPPKKPKTIKKIFIAVTITVTSMMVAWYLFLMIAFSGGIGNFIRDFKPAPNPKSSSMISKRNSAKYFINNSFAEIDGKTGFTSFGTSIYDSCFEGQNDAWGEDGYDHKCSYRVTKFYGFNGDFRQEMIDLEEYIKNAGWNSTNISLNPIKTIMKENYDVDYGVATTSYHPDGYFVSDLPTPTYLKDDGRIDINYAERAKKDITKIKYTQEIQGDTIDNTYYEKKFNDIDLLFDKITENNEFVLTISIQKDYFKD